MTSEHEQRLEKASGPSRRLLALLVGLLATLALIVSGAAAASAQNAVGPQTSGLILAVGSQTLAAQTSIGADGLAQLRQASATSVATDTAGTAGRTALDTTPAGRPYSAHYLNDTGGVRNIPGSVVDETIDNGQVAKDLPDRTVFYDPKNDVTVVESKTTGKIMSVRRGAP